ncbi:sodium channel protein 60E [Podospora fimiseda]|uniref:Sodium channel protein 60E n=1 Tax=Podospora fimiseda TaxID=252190 RepID=A0AAN7BSB6_9PEZI|nr:sodium channel protein 60E [Podospora fimiseda]
MADLGQVVIPPNQLASLLTALSSIDRRLSCIENTLKIHSSANNANASNAAGGTAAAAASGLGAGAVGPSAGQPALAAPPPPVAHQQHHHHQQPVTPINHATPSNGSLSNHPSPSPAQQVIGATRVNHLIPLEPPPQGYTITSRATMQEELDLWTIPRGYSMRIAGAKVTGKRKVRWVCFRGGEARHHRPPVDQSVFEKAKLEGRRKPTTDRASKKCGCMFKFEVIETAKDSDVWMLHYPNDEHKVHNHGPSDDTSDPRARKLPAFMLAEVDKWLRQGWLVSKIQDELKAKGFTNVLNTDLYNRKRLLKKEEGHSQME